MTRILRYPSPNFGSRRDDARPDLVVLHYTALANAEEALERLCDPVHEVSCHYLIGRDGRCWQLVDEADRAWHAGAGSWGGRPDVNSHSIGIELDNDGMSPFSERLMTTLEALLPAILERWSIPPARVIGHSDMAPGRKVDPGRRFDWQRLARRGLACWPVASAADEAAMAAEEAAPPPAQTGETDFRDALRRIGYPASEALPPLLDAFRARYRQAAVGPLSVADITAARRLARHFPVDPAAPAA